MRPRAQVSLASAVPVGPSPHSAHNTTFASRPRRLRLLFLSISPMLALRSLLGARVVSLRAFSTDAASSVAAKLNTVSVNPAAKAATAKPAADAAAAAKPVRVVREPLTWRVTRTASKQLPVYSEFKSAGNTKLTVVRRVEGDMWVRSLFHFPSYISLKCALEKLSLLHFDINFIRL